MFQIEHEGKVLAIVIPANYRAEGIQFFTPDNYSQQLAYIKHPAGKEIVPHLHNLVRREITQTQEVLFIRRGKVRVDFYNNQKEYLESTVLTSGDIILLASGGHGFEMLEETEMIEVKQGPYLGDQDKVRFNGKKTKH